MVTRKIGRILAEDEVRRQIVIYRETTCPKAFEKIVYHVYAYCCKIAIRYHHLANVEVDELANEGILKLPLIIKAFNVNGDVKFISYASVGLYRTIRYAALRHRFTFSYPLKFYDDYNRVITAIWRFKNDTGTMPTLDQIRTLTKLTESRFDHIMFAISPRTTSLDKPLNGHDSEFAELSEIIADTNVGYDPEKASILEALYTSIENLAPKQRALVKFSIRNPDYSIQECGRLLGKSRTGVQQCYADAVHNLKKAIV